MKTFELTAETRKSLGKRSTKDLRLADRVPCVVYGKAENKHFSVNKKDLKELVFTPNVYLVALKSETETLGVILQDFQFHPITDEVLHVDFYEFQADQPVVIKVPVVLTGFSEGVKAGGKLQLVNRLVKVSALAADLPDTLEVDTTSLGLGETIRVSQLSFPRLELVDPPKSIVATVKLTRAARGAMAKQ